MNDEEMKLLLEEVRKRGLSISEKDPVLSVLVGYDLLFRTHIKNTDLLLQQHKVDMTSIGEENYQKIRLLAIEKISSGLDQALDKMDTYTLKKISEINDVAHDVKPKQEIPIFYWVFTLMAGAMGYMLCLSNELPRCKQRGIHNCFNIQSQIEVDPNAPCYIHALDF